MVTPLTNAIIAFVIAWILSMLLTRTLIPFLEKKQFRQFVREEGPKSHLKKTGTPSMGGIAIISGSVIAGLAMTIVSGGFDLNALVPMVVMALFGLIGFLDDYEKAIKKNNLGLNPKQKIVLQLVFSIGFAIYAANYSGGLSGGGSQVWIPLVDQYIDFGWLYIPFVVFVMVAMSNAVNLTDGLDGLASGVTALVAVFMIVAGVGFGFSTEVIFFGAIGGGCIGFLMYNKNPARIFMGDTGSMALGGALAAGAVMMKVEFLLAMAGLIYVLEALSVVIQVAWFKKTGKRVFKMAPLHHHFELCGMSERKVVAMFWTATLVFCLIGILIMNV
ncbi:MAG: phospho-N-acetylmuramoyl-pentapeptide-transferase [Firmicutes bacterium]|nr:phospho-N-acetylmuramoyl-pentapeptide-transferase [Bacillota bacterium]